MLEKLLIALAIAGPFSSTDYKCPPPGWEQKLIIHHINVGQGDATFVRTPSGTSILIDAGLPKMGRSKVIPTLRHCYKLKKLDYVIATHFDGDHIGGLPDVFRRFKIGRVLDPGDGSMKKPIKENGLSNKYRRAALKRQRVIPKLGIGEIVSNDNVKFTIISVNGKILGGKQIDLFKKGELKNKNATSIVLKIGYGTFDYLIGGDTTGGGNQTPNVERLFAKVVGDIDVLHANHHGSNTSNSSYLLNWTAPEFVIISVGNSGLNKVYSLPNKNVLQRFLTHPNVKMVFQTSSGLSKINLGRLIMNKIRNEKGDIIIEAGPSSFTINDIRFLTDEK